MTERIKTLDAFAKHVNYSLLNTLMPDPESTGDGNDHNPRQVFSGHYVPVTPTPLMSPVYIAHSETLFAELGLDDSLATTTDFAALFSGDVCGSLAYGALWLGDRLRAINLRHGIYPAMSI